MNKTHHNTFPTYCMLKLLMISVLSIFVAAGYFVCAAPHAPDDYEELGALGDYFGGTIGTSLTFLSTVLIIGSIWVSLRAVGEARKHSESERLYALVFRIDDEVSAVAERLPSGLPRYSGPKQPTPRDEFVCIQAANIYRLMYHWLRRLISLEEVDALAIHICAKHGARVRSLARAGWFGAIGERDATIADFFTQQATKLGQVVDP